MQTASPAAASRVEIALAATARNTTFGALRTIFLKEGVAGLYQGVTAPLLAVTPAFAVTFWSYDMSKTLIRDFSDDSSGSNHFSVAQVALLAGAFSGIPLATIVAPSERIKCLMQVDKQRYSGFTDCARQVYREGGLRSVFKGSGATLCRDVPGNAAYFGTYEFCRRELCRREGTSKPSLSATLLAGGLAGMVNWTVAIPFDVLKSRLQTAPEGKYRNLWDAYRQLVREESHLALFRGLSPALIRAFPANAACLAGVETARSLFANYNI